jgi:UDPglucose 6-dehydrogenase
MIVIAGYGYVGKAFHEAFKEIYDCEIVDPAINENKLENFEPTHVICCVSTPQREDGSCYMENVYDVVSKTDKSVPILIKSTISIEGWRELKERFPEHSITFSPEFLRAKTAVKDFLNQKHIYLSKEGHSWTEFFKKRFPTAIYSVRKSAQELILAKYFRNSFLATKVAFFNQIYDLAGKMGLNYELIKEVVIEDDRIGHSHTDITEERGFGGHCFPKDTMAITETAKKHDSRLTLIEEAIKYNNEIRKDKTQ